MTLNKGGISPPSGPDPGVGATDSTAAAASPASSLLTPTMATLALTNAPVPTSSVASLTGLQHRQSPRHCAASASATRARSALTASSPQFEVPRKRVSSGTGICDTSSSPALAHLAKSSFSASTPNYILLNKLRIRTQQQSARSRTPSLPAGSASAQLSRTGAGSFTSVSPATSSKPKSSFGVSQSTQSSPIRSSTLAAINAPIELTLRPSASGSLASGRPGSGSSRPIVTRVTAQDWLAANQQRKDVSIARRPTSKPIAPNQSSISSSPCNSLHDRTCVSSSSFHLKRVRKESPPGKGHASKETPNGSKSSKAKSLSPPSVKSISIRADETIEKEKTQSPSVTESDGNERTSSSGPATRLHHSKTPTQGVATEEMNSSSGGQLRFQISGEDVPRGRKTMQSEVLHKKAPISDSSTAAATAAGCQLTPQRQARHLVGGQSGDESVTCDKEGKGSSLENKRPPLAGGRALSGTVGSPSRDSATVDDLNLTQKSNSRKLTRKPSSTLLAFIEKSSPELIFMLSESARLSYHLCQFEAKLDYLESIFCNTSICDSLTDRDSLVKATQSEAVSQANSWASVITRTRNWIAGVRLKNVLLEKRPDLKKVTSGKPTQMQDRPGVEEKENESFVASEDELIILLDRIVKFSSNIVSKLGTGKTTTYSETEKKESNSAKKTNEEGEEEEETGNLDSIVLQEKLNSLSGENSAKCKYEWLQSLPGNVKDLMEQLFPSGKAQGELLGKGTHTASGNAAAAADGSLPFPHIYQLNSELLNALVENVKTSARLVQLRREFDRLMCSHLKSIGHSMATVKSTSSAAAQLHKPRSSSQPAPAPPRASTECQSFAEATTKLAPRPSAVRWKPSSGISHSGSKAKESEGGSHEGHDSSKVNCCCVTAMVSDGDSGGEFELGTTATTVTNDFAQATDDELSSLLNQIAACSAKIIEQTGATSTSNTSTSSSGCCCSSTSIDAKCAAGCSLAAHFGHQSRSLHKDTTAHHHLEHPAWSSPLNSTQFKKSTPNTIRSPNCASCTAKSQNYSMQCTLKNQLSVDSQHLHKLQECQSFGKRNSYPASPAHNAPLVYQARGWPLIPSFDGGDLLHAASVGHMYGEGAHNESYPMRDNKMSTAKMPPMFHSKRSAPSMPPPMNESFMENMTGFMLSPSAMDLLSSTPAHQAQAHYQSHLGRLHQQQQQYSGEQQYVPVMAGSLADLNSAFIFDPNVDVESFLNEMEKELDDNCFASAPPFIARPGGIPLGPTAAHLSQRHQPDLGNSPHRTYRYSKQPEMSAESSHLQHRSCHHVTNAHVGSPLVNGALPLHSSHLSNVALSQSYPSLNGTITNRTMPPSGNATLVGGSLHYHDSPSSLLAGGGNWRLNQRNSLLDLEPGLVASPFNQTSSNQFHFPSTTCDVRLFDCSMPIGGSQSVANRRQTESMRYKRLIVPSASRDLLDKFRAQVSYREITETDNQLREIDQWLAQQLQSSVGRQAGMVDRVDSLAHQMAADQRRFSADELAGGHPAALTSANNCIYFGN